MIKNYWKLLTVLFFGWSFTFLTNFIGYATEVEDTYSIHVIKYKLENHEKLQNEFPINGTKMNELVDEEGNQLKKMSGIDYNIKKMKLKVDGTDDSNLSSYEPEGDNEMFSMDIRTNDNGEAVINGLTKGAYQVTEKPNQAIKNVMTPVLVKLPLVIDDKQLNHVYIYPKSSVLSNNMPSVRSGLSKLPETSGTLGSYVQLILMLFMISIMGFISLYCVNKKIQN